MGLIEYFHPSLADVNFEQRSTQLKFTAGSFVFFCLVYVVSMILSGTLKTYRNLRIKEKIFWHLAIVRGVYGIFCIVIGVWALFIDTELVHDVVYATTPTSHFAMTTTVGFFIFECTMILWSDIYYQTFSVLLNIHHWLSLIGYSMIICLGSTHYFGTRGLILEMSTPFSCLCWTLLKADMANTFFWKANQFMLVHAFHLRSVMECNMWYVTYQHWEQISSTMPVSMFVLLYLQLTLVTFLMTPYWTYKKTVQMINPVDWNFEDSNKNKAENDQKKDN